VRTVAHDTVTTVWIVRRHVPHHHLLFIISEFTFASKVSRCHNILLGKVVGADGLKTGYIRASGFNLVTSVGRGGRRIVAVVMGGETAKSRDAHMEELIELYLPKATPAGV